MAEPDYTTAEDLLRMQAEMQAKDQALAAQGYAPGETPSEEEQAQMQMLAQAEQLPEPDMPFADPFTDPFADASSVGFADPFAATEEELVNPLEDYSEFPEEPGTSRASQELGEMFVPPMLGGDAPRVGPGRTTEETGGGVGSTLTLAQRAAVATAAMTMTDPQEIANMLKEISNDVIGITYAPDGAIIATNNETGARGLINRPGASGMDALQMLGLGAMFTPAGRFASMGVKTVLPRVASATMRKQLEKAAVRRASYRMAGAAGATQTGIEAGHEAVPGGDFDPEDIAFTAVAGKVGEHLAKPLANVAAKGKELIGYTVDIVPKGVQQALDYAKSTGRKIYTSDALSQYISPIQNIFFKTIERVPITGIGRQRIRQKAARTDALIDIANKYGIDIESELGQDIADNFITRMIKQRFWGKNKEIMDPENWPSGVTQPQARREAQAKAHELLERAFVKESESVVDVAIAKQLRDGNLTDETVERVLDQGTSKRVVDLFNKLMPEGKQAVKRRFLIKGMEKSGWTPDAPQIADPDGFVKYLSTPKNRKMLKVFFDEGEQELLEGAREYMRITALAAQTGKGSGMVAAMGGGAAVGLAVLNGLWGVAAATALAGQVIQGPAIRNALLKLTYAKGDPTKAQAIMKELRGLVVAAENQYFESGGPPELPDIEFNKEMMKDLGDYGMEYLRTLGDRGMEKFEDVTGELSRMLTE
jgi:hypothetical protein